jgi:hypothetical protein
VKAYTNPKRERGFDRMPRLRFGLVLLCLFTELNRRKLMGNQWLQQNALG